MHGVRKVKNPEEVDRQKKLEIEAKIQKYKVLLNAVNEKRRAKAYDEAALTLTGQLIAVNPEYYTMWNYRREILQHLFEAADVDKKAALLKELQVTEDAIKKNPKCYWVWNHRTWTTQQLGADCEWKRELALCAQLLDLDQRNFHCWNYRRYVVREGKPINDKENLDFTTKKIEQNFSNYSAWQQRSALLPVVYDSPEALSDALTEEFELVKSAFYTEPSDQSAWFYHRWLRTMSSSKERLRQELEMCEELLNEEPNSKWALLTKVFIMEELKEGLDQANDILGKLVTIDPLRTNFYKDYSVRLEAIKA
eukprot:TRINITY_DN7705_c0_g1_i1.p1 TRINITY_DN7705_c0_g1~~TRINITY_DN7705_c0_g1_i1.p1  ORF type:complete len:309 (-),score=91.60 TRINITY_DN7705_c0_g1_i1:120-1046(-)